MVDGLTNGFLVAPGSHSNNTHSSVGLGGQTGRNEDSVGGAVTAEFLSKAAMAGGVPKVSAATGHEERGKVAAVPSPRVRVKG